MRDSVAPESRSKGWSALLLAASVALAPSMLFGATGAALAESLKFCFTEWKPYSATENGKPVGISIDILTEAAKRAGIDAGFQELPWKRCLADVLDGTLDVAIDGAPRDGYWHGESTHTSSYYVFFVAQSSPLTSFTGLPQFAGKSVSLIQGWWYPDALTNAKDIKLERLFGEKNQLQALALGRQDAAFGDLITMGVTARELAAAVRPLSPMLEESRYFPHFNTSRQASGQAIDKALAAMLADGAVDRIYQQHIGVTFSGLRDTARGSGGTAKAN